MGLALLYAYRSQTPAITTYSITEAVQDVQAGKVKSITFVGNTATLELNDSTGTKKQTKIPDGSHGDDPLSVSITTFNAANPTRQVIQK